MFDQLRGARVYSKIDLRTGYHQLRVRDTDFLGLVGYYRRFIEDFSRIAVLMTRLTRKEVKFKWDDRCEEAFQELKMRLTSAPILIVPDRGQGYIVYCDASRAGLGFVLMQS